MRAFIFVLGAMLAAALSAGVAHAQERGAVSAADQRGLAGPWRGEWVGGASLYEGEMTLTVSAEGDVEGQIVWTLRQSPNVDPSLIGRTGVEHLLGTYYPETGALRLEGHRKDDPDNIIGLDTYRLIVGRNHAMMVGLTGNHGTWDGLLTLRR